jgi:hypothetical protein
MMKGTKIVASLVLGAVGYWCTVVGLDALIRVLGNTHPLRALVGALWAGSQPFAFGGFVFALEALACYWLLGLRQKRA